MPAPLALTGMSGQRMRVWKDLQTGWWCTRRAGFPGVIWSHTWREAFDATAHHCWWWGL